MRILRGRNVNDVYLQGRALIEEIGVRQRNERTGLEVMVAPFPVMSVYERPQEKVLFCPARDANPFFHLVESLWMLSGSADARCLDQYVRGFSERYSESYDGLVHGAYGRRWRRWFGDGTMDQLRIVVDRLRRDPGDRRVVIGMWDPTHDLCDPSLLENATDAYREPLDVPCNTHVYPRLRQENWVDDSNFGVRQILDLTVCCRSNDLVWGAHGANAVHFAVLQEYLAAGVGAEVGRLYQLSNNYHAYVDVFEKTRSKKFESSNFYELDLEQLGQTVQPSTMITDFEKFDQDVACFMEGEIGAARKDALYTNRWMADVAAPVARAGALWRAGARPDALDAASECQASDWRAACQMWMRRRME